MTKPLAELAEKKEINRNKITALENRIERLMVEKNTQSDIIAKLRREVALWRERAMNLEMDDRNRGGSERMGEWRE